jgi:hypothetical protein
VSVLGELQHVARHVTDVQLGAAWPAPIWQAKPIAFANTILGVELHGWQRDFLTAIAESPRVSCAGGRKVGKDFTVAVAALWWWASFEDAKVILTAPTSRQVDRILWKEIRRLYRGSGRCVACKRSDPTGPRPCPHSAELSGKLGELAHTGLRAFDDREIRGETANEAEGAAGVSGSRLLYILDEASAIDDATHATIRGNLASGQSREVLISNPTRPRGFFFDSHHAKAHLYRTLRVSSCDSPNVLAGEDIVPGLASASWLADTERDWGRDSPLFRVHVLGEFVLNEAGRAFTVHAIAEAEKKWADTKAEGRIIIGLDPAGDSGLGDESVFAVRRGMKIVRLHARRGLSDDAHVEEALALIEVEQRGEPSSVRPQIVIDRDGSIGARVWSAFVAYQMRNPTAFELRGVRGGERAVREPLTYGSTRDEVFANLEKWLREGGAIPTDTKLSAELAEFQWATNVQGRSKITPKDDLKKILGRSPDRADGVSLAAWGRETDLGAPMPETSTPAVARQSRRSFNEPEIRGVPELDAYAALDVFQEPGRRR